MIKKSAALIGTAIFIAYGSLGLLGIPASANRGLPEATAPTVSSGEARAPYGWIEFCSRMAGECSLDTSEPDRVALTAGSFRTLDIVNRAVNREIEPMTDQAHWGKVESWDLPTDGIGDCEDYVLLKRKRLAAAGIPQRAMRVTVVLDEVGDGHAVLMVRTNRGDLILDNKHDRILPWLDTGYVYIKRESQHRIGWTSLGGTRGPTATASR